MLISKKLTHTEIHFWSCARTQQHVWGQSGLHATSQSVSERRSFFNAEQSDKGKTEKKESALLSIMGGTSIMTVWEVNTSSGGTDGIVMFILPVLDMHHSDLSHTIIKAHEVFIQIRGRGWWEGSRGVETSSFFLCRYVNRPLMAMTHLGNKVA